MEAGSFQGMIAALAGSAALLLIITFDYFWLACYQNLSTVVNRRSARDVDDSAHFPCEHPKWLGVFSNIAELSTCLSPALVLASLLLIAKID
jgi:hypothetical protein